MFGGWQSRVPEGEDPPAIFVLASTMEQSRITFSNIRRFLRPFSKMIIRETADEITLSNGIKISVKASDYRSVRGFRTCLVILDEVAFLPQRR